MRAVSAVARIARVLLAQPDGEPVALSNAQLAKLSKTTGRNVRRCLTQLREAGAVEIRKSSSYTPDTGHRLLIPVHANLARVLNGEL